MTEIYRVLKLLENKLDNKYDQLEKSLQLVLDNQQKILKHLENNIAPSIPRDEILKLKCKREYYDYERDKSRTCKKTLQQHMDSEATHCIGFSLDE